MWAVFDQILNHHTNALQAKSEDLKLRGAPRYTSSTAKPILRRPPAEFFAVQRRLRFGRLALAKGTATPGPTAEFEEARVQTSEEPPASTRPRTTNKSVATRLQRPNRTRNALTGIATMT